MAPDDAAGKSGECPRCGQATTIPDDDPLAGFDEFLAQQQAATNVASPPVTSSRQVPVRLLIVAALALGGVTYFFSNKGHPPVTTVTTFPDAFRRLELRGYRHVKDRSALGQDIASYKRVERDAGYTAEISRWSGDSRIMLIMFACSTDENGFQSEEAALGFWDKLKYDLYAMVDCGDEYHRALADLRPVEVDGSPIMRNEGQATTADGWQILVIQDVRQYKPHYKDPAKFWARVGMIWVLTAVENCGAGRPNIAALGK